MEITIGNDSFNVLSWDQLNTLNRAAIYTIWTYDPKTRRYPLLYVGETGDVESRLSNHPKYKCWTDHKIEGLYVGVRLMSSDRYTKEQRKTEEQRLIKVYKPVCND